MLTKHDDWHEQLDDLQGFMSTWLGMPVCQERFVARLSPPPGVPRMLAEFLTFPGGGDNSKLFTQNKFDRLEELEPEKGRFVFYAESQGVYLWATDASSDNPPVYGRFNDGKDRWHIEEERLAGFLCQACIFEAVIRAPQSAHCDCLPDTELDAILQHWSTFPFGSWRWPAYPTKFYYAKGALAVVAPNISRAHTVYCGARDADSLAFMQQFIDEDWY